MEEQTKFNRHVLYWEILFPLLMFLILWVIGNLTINQYCVQTTDDCPLLWPMSIFAARIPTVPDILFALVIFFAFRISLSMWHRTQDFWLLLFSVNLLIIGTNLLAGWHIGFELPTTYGEAYYYYDAIEIDNSIEFINSYEELQVTTLGKHSRTNPPGSTLLLYFVHKLITNIGWMNIFLTIVAGTLTSYFMWKIMRIYFSDTFLSGYMTWTLLLLPAVQIYYGFKLDAIIASLMLGTLFFFLHQNPRLSIVGSTLFLFMASFMTFITIFLLPVLVGFSIWKQQYLGRLLSIIIGIIGIYLVLFMLFEFNYVNTFRIAAEYENPEGFRLFSDLSNYLLTRIESIVEIFFFFSPFLLVYLSKEYWQNEILNHDLLILSILAFASLGGMLFVGMFSTGETARLCLFFYPYLLFPVAHYFHKRNLSKPQANILLSLCFGQTVLMQLFGIYFG